MLCVRPDWQVVTTKAVLCQDHAPAHVLTLPGWSRIGALGEARMRSGMRTRKRGAETAAVLAEIAEELQLVAEGRAGPAIRCPALEALFWFEVGLHAHSPYRCHPADSNSWLPHQAILVRACPVISSSKHPFFSEVWLCLD